MDSITDFLSKVNLIPQNKKYQYSNDEHSDDKLVEISNYIFPTNILVKYNINKTKISKTPQFVGFDYEKYCNTDLNTNLFEKTSKDTNRRISNESTDNMEIISKLILIVEISN